MILPNLIWSADVLKVKCTDYLCSLLNFSTRLLFLLSQYYHIKNVYHNWVGHIVKVTKIWITARIRLLSRLELNKFVRSHTKEIMIRTLKQSYLTIKVASNYYKNSNWMVLFCHIYRICNTVQTLPLKGMRIF